MERLAGIAVVGYGKVVAQPDLARTVFTAQVEAATAAEARSHVVTVVSAMLAAIEEAGIAETDRQTTGIRFDSWRESARRPPRHCASQRLSVRIRDVEASGTVIENVLSAGGDKAGLEGLVLEVENREPHLDAAQERAMDDASRKARHLAELAGRPLGPVVAISENRAHAPFAVGEDVTAFAAERTGRAIPVAAGEVDFEAYLAVEFAWGD